MKVERIKTATGSHIEPPLKKSWDRLKQLSWHAAVASLDTGLTITVEPTTTSWSRDYLVSIVGHSGHSQMSYSEAWVFINGISSGASAMKRSRRNPTDNTRSNAS